MSGAAKHDFHMVDPSRWPMVGCGCRKPEPGMLVLFPSYMWHGTIPFVTGDSRLTIAFDIVPD